MMTPTEVGGDYGLGFSRASNGNYFSPGGSDWGFISSFLAHKEKGYGIIVMTNGNAGYQITGELVERVAEVYQWDSATE
ncbi:MAG: hypothetical protein VCD00_04165 [Candidatus Hydrogenedentota bacterium]